MQYTRAAIHIEKNISLAHYTTFRIGGPATFFIHATTDHDLKDALAYAQENKLRVCLLGTGSNILVPDEGLHCVVIKVETRGIELHDVGSNTVEVAARNK